MSIYIILFLIMLYCSFIKKESFFLCVLVILIFTVIRYDVGWDYRPYYIIAKDTSLQKIAFNNFTKEELIRMGTTAWKYYNFEYINRIIYYVTWYLRIPYLPIIVYGILNISYIYKSINLFKINQKKYWLFFLSFPQFYFYYLSIMRQGVAVSIVLYATIKYLFNKKNKKYILMVLFASLFHKTALFMIVLIPLYKYSYLLKNKKIRIFIVSIIYFFGDFILKIMFKLKLPYLYYFKNNIGSGGSKVFYLIIILFIISIIFEKKIIKEDKRYFEINVFIFTGTVIYISLGKFGDAGQRMSNYFLIFILLTIDSILKTFKNKKYKTSTYLLVIYIYIISCLILYLSIFFLDLQKTTRRQYIPYKTIFQARKNNYLEWEEYKKWK